MDISNVAGTLSFTLICFFFAIYITTDQFKKYFKNEDISSFKIKSFSGQTTNRYPDISICYIVANKSFYNKRNFPYKMTSLFEIFNDSNRNDGNDFTPQPMGVFEDAWVNSRNGISSHYRSFRDRTGQPMDRNVVTWLNAITPCVTLKLDYTPFDVLSRQNVYLNIEKMQKFKFMGVFIHHPGQLIKGIGSTYTSDMSNAAALWMRIPGKYTPERNLADVFITQVKILKRRSKPDDPCNEDLYDDDGRWVQEASRLLGCVPVFWKNIPLYFNNSTKSIPCTTYGQYMEAYKYAKNTGKIAMSYDPSCQTTTSISYSRIGSASKAGIYKLILNELNLKELILLRISYKITEFEDITNERLFNQWDLFSQVGGTIGLLLGFTFLQIPDIIKNFLAMVKTKLHLIDALLNP